MWNGKFNTFFGTGFKDQPVLRTYNSFFLRLKTDAANAIGIASRGNRYGAFPPA